MKRQPSSTAKLIRLTQKATGASLKQLADKLGERASTLSLVLSGKRPMVDLGHRLGLLITPQGHFRDGWKPPKGLAQGERGRGRQTKVCPHGVVGWSKCQECKRVYKLALTRRIAAEKKGL